MASSHSSNDEFIHIDGSFMEGGGQIIRITTALSVILNKPIKISNIRAGRKDGGLKAQHLTGIRLLADLSEAKLVGGELKSTQIEFIPSQLKSGTFYGDTKTAGSICLLLQSALPPLLFGKEESCLHLRGGTNAENAPQIDYFTEIFTHYAKQFGIEYDYEIKKRGYYPKGGGEFYIKIKPLKQLNSVDFTDFGGLDNIYGRCFVAGFLKINIAERMAKAAKEKVLNKFKSIDTHLEAVREPSNSSFGDGCGLIITAKTKTNCLIASSDLGSLRLS
jgi:RNA 3'-terminal phosphate cyclase (ATP)